MRYIYIDIYTKFWSIMLYLKYICFFRRMMSLCSRTHGISFALLFWLTLDWNALWSSFHMVAFTKFSILVSLDKFVFYISWCKTLPCFKNEEQVDGLISPFVWLVKRRLDHSNQRKYANAFSLVGSIFTPTEKV